jgi:hypothetical protein
MHSPRAPLGLLSAGVVLILMIFTVPGTALAAGWGASPPDFNRYPINVGHYDGFTFNDAGSLCNSKGADGAVNDVWDDWYCWVVPDPETGYSVAGLWVTSG